MLISLASYYTPTASGVWTPSQAFAAGQRGGWYVCKPMVEGVQVLWKDLARTDPVTADGDLVRVMDDLSPNGLHASVPSDAARPIYQTDGTLHWLLYDGVDDTFLTAATPSIPDNTNGMLFCAGIRSAGTAFKMAQYSGTNNARVFGANILNNTDFDFTVQVAGTYSSDRIASNFSVPTTDAVTLGSWAGADAFSQARVNRGTFSTASTATPAITSVSQAIEVGSYDYVDGGSNYTDGRLYGCIYVGDTTYMTEIEDYIAGLAGVTLP